MILRKTKVCALISLLFIHVQAAVAGVVVLGQDGAKDLMGNRLSSTPTDAPSEADRQRLINILDGITDIIPSHALNCVEEQLLKISVTSLNEVANKEVWLANSGVVSDFTLKAAKNPCFAVLIDDFYEELGPGKASSQDLGLGDRLLKGGRPALNSAVGEGSFQSQEKGFVWEAAMKAAAGDANLAMELIGYCGHDDQEQNHPGVIIEVSKESSIDTIFQFLGDRAERKAMENEINGDSFESALKLIRESNQVFINKMQADIKKGHSLATEVNCPDMSSHFYAPGAVAGSLILSKDFVDRVAKLQAPTMGAGVLPAKAYHGNFAAMLACRMKSECGVSADVSKWILNKVASTYRSVRLSQMQQKYLKLKERLEDTFDIRWADEQGLNALSGEMKAWVESPSNKDTLIKMGLSELLSWQKNGLDWERTKEYIDTAVLVRGGDTGQSFKAIALSAGRDPFHDPEYYQTKGRPQTSYCPGWSEERCSKARNRYETWMIDFEWSEKQQEAGVDFAYQNCGKEPVDIEASSCGAMKKRIEAPNPARMICSDTQMGHDL